MVLHLNKLERPSPNDALCHVCEILPSGSGEEEFLNFVDVFSLIRS